MVAVETPSVLSRKLQLMFRMMNEKSDGRLTEGEVLGLADRLASAFGQDAASQKIERLREPIRVLWTRYLQSMDNDHNGYITPQESQRGWTCATSTATAWSTSTSTPRCSASSGRQRTSWKRHSGSST